MYELIQAGEKTYYIDCPAKMGIYRINDREVCLIDSGNDKEAGKKVLKILEANGWALKMILNTHSHADHIGGNNFLQQKTGCSIYVPGVDSAFAKYPVLEPSFLYGGYPFRELRNKFLLAQESSAQVLTQDALPDGLTLLRIDGHSIAMAAIKTSDDVWFLADSLSSEAVLQKYNVTFLYDVKGHFDALETVGSLQGKLFIPAHAAPSEDIQALVNINRDKMLEIIALLKTICQAPVCFEDILKSVFDHYGLTMDCNQYVLAGTTLRSYLSYLHDLGEMDICFENNRLLWRTAQ